MVTNLMMKVKLAMLSGLKTKLFWSKCYEVINSVSDLTSKTLPCEWTCIIDLVIWPKFGNANISMREVIITSVS